MTHLCPFCVGWSNPRRYCTPSFVITHRSTLLPEPRSQKIPAAMASLTRVFASSSCVYKSKEEGGGDRRWKRRGTLYHLNNYSTWETALTSIFGLKRSSNTETAAAAPEPETEWHRTQSLPDPATFFVRFHLNCIFIMGYFIQEKWLYWKHVHSSHSYRVSPRFNDGALTGHHKTTEW